MLSSLSLPNFKDATHNFTQFFEQIDFANILKVAIYMVIGIIITLYISRIVARVSEKHISAHHSQLLSRVTFYFGLILAIILPLRSSGIDVTGLLGAAGIAAGIITAAVAFASQTSISNFLSGVFLIAEKPFVVGDYVFVDDTLGEVLSIDLLSVKIRTKDNILVRIPNEMLLKSKFRNVSRFPIRRCDIKIRVSFNEDLQKLKEILLETAKKNALCLVSPAPELNFIEFGDSAILLQFSVWSTQAVFNQFQTNIQMEIQAALRANHIELPSLPTLVTSK